MHEELIGGTLLNLELSVRRTVRSVIFVGIVQPLMAAKASRYGILNYVRFERKDAAFVRGAMLRAGNTGVDTEYEYTIQSQPE